MGQLEATMIVLDSSEFMRNGDYTPTRFEAQLDAVNLIFQAKTASNPENTVGVMTMGGSSAKVLTSFTADFGKILSGVHGCKIGGETHLSTGIQVAGLALKHRQNKKQKQRIIVFVASPITESVDVLNKLARKMKKNSIAIDFINFGEESENTDKLEKFIEAINTKDNSHLVTVPPGPHLLSDIITSSPIVSGESGQAGGFGGGMGGADDFMGIDPSVDPDLALALRMSLEDEKARQEREKQSQEQAQQGGQDEAQASQTGQDAAAAPEQSSGAANEEQQKKDDENAMKDD